MKNLKPRSRPTAAEALAIASETAPTMPPAQMPILDRPTTLNMRLRETTVGAITAAAKARGMTIKQFIVLALADAGVSVAPADLENRTPRRGGRGVAAVAERYRHVGSPSRNAVGSP